MINSKIKQKNNQKNKKYCSIKIKKIHKRTNQQLQTSDLEVIERNRFDSCCGIPLDKLPPCSQKDGYFVNIIKCETKGKIEENTQTIGKVALDSNGNCICISPSCNRLRDKSNDSFLHKNGRCKECQKLYRNSIRKMKTEANMIEDLKAQIHDMKAQITNLKSKIQYRDQKIRFFDNIFKEKDSSKENYLIALLHTAINQELISSDMFFCRLIKNTLENIVKKKSPNQFRFDFNCLINYIKTSH